MVMNLFIGKLCICQFNMNLFIENFVFFSFVELDQFEEFDNEDNCRYDLGSIARLCKCTTRKRMDMKEWAVCHLHHIYN